jgi:hypothetical protein
MSENKKDILDDELKVLAIDQDFYVNYPVD